MKSITTIFTTLLLTATFLSTPARATTTDAIILKQVDVTSILIESGTPVELVLTLQTQKYFEWDPSVPSTGGYVNAVYCPTNNLVDSSCSFPKSISFYRVQTIDNYEIEYFDTFNITTLRIEGIIDEGALGQFSLYSIRISGADLPHREEVHVYIRNKIYAEEAMQPRTDILVPDFSVADIEVVEALPVLNPEEPSIEEPADEDIVQEDVVPVPDPPAQTPARPNSPRSSVPQLAPVVAPAIQSNFFLPAIKGDQHWRPLREVKGNFENWRVGKKNSLDGVANRFTKTNGSLMTFSTTGDAVSVRYLAGKKKGGFSIYVDGKFIDRVDASNRKKRHLVKTWDGLGEGKHYVDIVAELSNGQSLAINGVHRLKN